MTPIEILEDERFTVPVVPPGSEGVGWLRASVVRFCEGDERIRRRALVEELLGNIPPSALRLPGDHVATLLRALDLDTRHAADVRAIAACYQPSQTVTVEADAAVERLVEACGGAHDESTAAVICVLVQAATATANLIKGLTPPVPSTVRIAPTGESLTVDLTSCPFGAGRHQCPGREHALALADGATQ